jgi:undecaprenyl-diphosphatase
VKVKSFCAPRPIVATVAQGRTVLRGCWFLMRTQKLLAFSTVALAVGLALVLFPHDTGILARVHVWRGESEDVARSISWQLGTWGDFPTYNLPLALAIWLYGVWKKSSAWRRVAVICFLGASLAGLFDDFFRLTLGRPRPDAHRPDGFYGLTYALRSGFESFPSGHAASVFGAAAALFVVNRPLGLLTTAFAFAVVWARMELNRHYPSDVAVGTIIGLYFGLMVGFGAKLRLPHPPSAARNSSTDSPRKENIPSAAK